MVWIGGMSYEIFLAHVAVMAIFMKLMLHWLLFTGSQKPDSGLISLYS
jgi:peptidoglycan/LPS O-acetylase OafA/YrhL